MPAAPAANRQRTNLLELLHYAHVRDGWLTAESVTDIAVAAGIPVAEAWEAATSYPDFRFAPPTDDLLLCTGLSCLLAGGAAGPGTEAVGCRFRCYAAPVSGNDQPFPETAIRLGAALLAPEDEDWAGLEAARALGPRSALAQIEASGLRGRGGAYFPVARKWEAALAERRPIALVINAEEGEPGVFKDRAILCRRPRRFLEGLAIAREVLDPTEVIVFINGEAAAAVESLRSALAAMPDLVPGPVRIVRGGGGYVLGEESTLLNALEGRKPVPRLRPPYPVEAGYFGMPTVINNVETITNLPLLFREGVDRFRARGSADCPGTKIFSVSGNVANPGAYELPVGATLREVLAASGGSAPGNEFAVLCGGPSGGFLPATEFDRPLQPGPVHETGAILGAGGLVFLDDRADIRAAALAMARFNAEESCGKCTPCREGSPRATAALAAGSTGGLGELLDVIQYASLCGLGQMATGPIRSALHFWPGAFR